MSRCRLAWSLGWVGVFFAAGPVQADFSFTYNGHSYTLVTTARTWDAAHTNAVALGGTLARVDDAAENQAILTNLLGKGIATTAPDGGGAIYVWIGGRELAEGTYGWLDRASNATAFWTGGKTGGPTNGLYSNWGRNSIAGGGPEPDNFNGTQNRAGFALEAWPRSGANKIGQAGQWNDINGTDLLVSLVERAPPSAPSNLHVTVTGPATISLSWTDTADNEGGFIIAFREGTSGSFYSLGNSLPANSTNKSGVAGAVEGATYQFFVRATNALGVADSPVVTSTMPGLTSRPYHPAVVGQPFSYTLTATSDAETPERFDLVGALPPGLLYNTNTHQLTGTPAVDGVFTPTTSVHYPAWGTISRVLALRVIYPPGAPVATASIPKQTLLPSQPPMTLPLADFFADLDTEQAVQFNTTKGSFDLALYSTATPQTVSNFLNYVNRGDYSNSILHRSVPGFIVQGGGFKPAPPNFTKIPTDPSPTNEPGVQNVRGTLAMAKLGGNPNSATDQWFINLADNSENLDNQNGGFTAFGRVCGNGMGVAEAIAALPRGNYTVNVDGQNMSFSDWPLDTPPPAPASMDLTKLVLVNSVRRIEPLRYAVVDDAVPGLVVASVQGASLVLTPTNRFGGLTRLTIHATDLDGNSVTQAVTVEVSTPYSAWLNQYTLDGANSTPDADPEGDMAVNMVEFALVGSPILADRAALAPTGGFSGTGAERYPALTFRLRKDLGGAIVRMKSASTLSPGAWSESWTSARLDSPQVVQRLDRGDHWLVTVRDALPLGPAQAARFLRLLVETPVP